MEHDPERQAAEVGARQLAALGRVAAHLQSEGIDYWLFGGWPVDFYAGSITRVHEDVDIAIWHEDLGRIAALLGSDGWRHSPGKGRGRWDGIRA